MLLALAPLGACRSAEAVPEPAPAPILAFRAELAPDDPNWKSAETIVVNGEELRLGPARSFTITEASRTADDLGYPALAFEIAAPEQSAFTSWTASLVDRRMACLVDWKPVSAPFVRSALPGRGIIRGSWTEAEVDDLVRRLRASAP